MRLSTRVDGRKIYSPVLAAFLPSTTASTCRERYMALRRVSHAPSRRSQHFILRNVANRAGSKRARERIDIGHLLQLHNSPRLCCFCFDQLSAGSQNGCTYPGLRVWANTVEPCSK